ncbi:MAG: hypothetical protein QHH13_08090 [Melioribacter sp.]|nr:hypothetical protein [Melioribacter sp.]
MAEWEMYDRMDPIGERRADFRMAELASLIVNIAIKWAAGKKPVKLMEITDFIPQWDVTAPKQIDVKKQSTEEIKKALLEIANAHNKKDKIKKRGINKPPANLIKKKNG